METPYEKVYSRLGFRPGKTKISDKQREQCDSYIAESLDFISLKAAAIKLKVKMKGPMSVDFENGISFTSSLLRQAVGESNEVFFWAATAGKDIIKEIKRTQKKNLTRSIVFDAVASEITDKVFDWLKSYFDRELLRQKKVAREKRISCGYGDFLLENQKKIFNLLELNKIQIKLTDNYILIPEKSVTAVCAIKEVNGNQ